MAQISQETKEQILAATDIVDVIGSYIEVKRAGPSFKALCPFHNEKSPSFNINPQRQFFHCFGCKKSGDAITFVREYENLPYVDAIKKLAARVGITVTEQAFDPKEDRARRQRGRQLDIHREVAAFLHQLLFTREATHARDYLKSRGFGKEMAQRWQIGWMPDSPQVFMDWARAKKFTGRELVDSGIFVQKERGGIYVRFLGRLMIPIRNEHGDVIAFTARQLHHDPKSGKYINSPETSIFKKSNVLFALERARKAILNENAVVICEGQLDVISCHEQGIEHVIGTQGTAITPNHARLLRRYAKNAIVCFDADNAGILASEKAFRVLSEEGIPVRIARMPSGEDPDSFIRKNGPDAFRQLLTNAVSFFDFKIELASANGGLDDLQRRVAFVRECASLLAVLPDAVGREATINHVATRLHSGAPELREAVNRIVRANKNKGPERTRGDTPPEPEKIEPIAIDPVVAYLCGLALHSGPAQEWLGEQFETLHEAANHIEGIPLLEAVLSARPDATSHAAVNSFIAGLSEAQRLAILSDPTFHDDPPEHPIQAAESALAELSAKVLHRRDQDIKAQMSRPGLPADEMIRLLHEAKEIAHLLKGVDQRFVFSDRFAPSRKPTPPGFQRRPPYRQSSEKNP
ncbi:MAG: DNA primase [Verrucomicrobia bacterium]|nr:MAG: DNA primase [Verrucomicrobiota bacterium]TAE88735.1 MAG: DNA primase [Verrucomicrobiota bacterium]TAF26537.1 MAG: DNA primase [Verrucomicrobiota bacterium]